MNKLQKGFLCFGLAALMTAAFAACGEEPEPTPTPGGDGGGTVDPIEPGTPGGSEPEVPANTNPSVVGTAEGYYYAASPADIKFNMYMNGGTFVGVKEGETQLTRNEEYRFNIGTEVLTINQTWLSTLTTGDYTLTFQTDKGSCDIALTVGGSDLIEGYNMQFAKPNANSTADHFFAKGSRDADSATFDFRTFGDFTAEGTGLEFINLLIDVAPFDDTGINWRLSSEDINVRLYSDGSVIYRKDFTGTETKNGVSNGMDNIWWRTNRTTPNYQEGDVDDVTISREKGVTSFSLDLPYTFLEIESTDDFRFAVMECSDASSFDFNLYENGIVELNGTALQDPVFLNRWPMFTAEGTIIRPEDIVVEIPQGYDLSFAESNDAFSAKIEKTADGVTFEFCTLGNFAQNGLGRDEFLNVYLDMPDFNKNGMNWCFEEEDINLRIYSDGRIYKKTGFTPSSDNLWYNHSVLTNDDKLEQTAAVTRAGGLTTVVATVTYEQLGTTASDFEGFRFWMAECAEQDNQFAYNGADFKLNGVSAGTDALLPTWPMFTAEGDTIPANEIPMELPEGFDLAFGISRDEIFSDIAYAENTGVTFSFYTKGDFNQDNGTLEFVQIYIDMPSYNLDQTGNWQYREEDVALRIYSDGSVYRYTDFNGNADNIWFKTNHEDSKYQTIEIDRTNGVTTFNLTVTLSDLGVTELTDFRFYMAECSDNSTVDFSFGGSDLKYGTTSAGDAAFFRNFLMFRLADSAILLPSEIPAPETGVPADYKLSMGLQHDVVYAKVAYAEGTGVTFSFYTEGDFSKDGDTTLEFVQIYIDMPTYNFDQTGNWQYRMEDVAFRIYSDGSVYRYTNFDGSADNIWFKTDHTAAKFKTIEIDKGTDATTFDLTVTLSDLGVTELTDFRFWMAECSDNSQNDFAFYDNGDMKYGTASCTGAHDFDNFLMFRLADSAILLPSEIPA